jgi:hypothetical protein
VFVEGIVISPVTCVFINRIVYSANDLRENAFSITRMHLGYNALEMKPIKKCREVNDKRKYEKGSNSSLVTSSLIVNYFDYQLYCQRTVNIPVCVKTITWCGAW